MCRDVMIEWLRPQRIAEGGASGGGIYLWYLPNFPAVVYIGETADYKARLVQQVANSIGYGGTVCNFCKNDIPYKLIDCSNLNRTVEAGKINYPWTMTERSKSDFLKSLDNDDDEEVITKIRFALSFLRAVRVLYGRISDKTIDRKEIEGGLIAGFRKNLNIANYGRYSNNTILGKISKYPTQSYRLIANPECDAEGIKWAETLLKEAVPGQTITI